MDGTVPALIDADLPGAPHGPQVVPHLPDRLGVVEAGSGSISDDPRIEHVIHRNPRAQVDVSLTAVAGVMSGVFNPEPKAGWSVSPPLLVPVTNRER